MPAIQDGLFENYEPYKEAIDAGEETGSASVSIASAAAVWAHVKPAHVLIEPVEGVVMIEVAFTTEWDVEHTVAAIFREWQFSQFNGSVRGQ